MNNVCSIHKIKNDRTQIKRGLVRDCTAFAEAKMSIEAALSSLERTLSPTKHSETTKMLQKCRSSISVKLTNIHLALHAYEKGFEHD